MTDQTWRQRAACRRKPTNDWFPVSTKDQSVETLSAKRTCAGCPVRLDCVLAAFRDDDRYGIRGGVDLGTLSAKQRSALRQRVEQADLDRQQNVEPVAAA